MTYFDIPFLIFCDSFHFDAEEECVLDDPSVFLLLLGQIDVSLFY